MRSDAAIGLIAKPDRARGRRWSASGSGEERCGIVLQPVVEAAARAAEHFGDGRLLVHRLAYNGDIAAGQLAVFQGGPF